ncbi:hypothetical protein LZK73_03700 [Neorhizobium galegae]|nr:hypothetical protein LZK73_03700 [Neorhizobium galegae]
MRALPSGYRNNLKDHHNDRKKIVLATLGAALIAGTAIPAFAAPGRDGPGRHDGPGRAMMQDVMFVRLLKNADADKDGKVSKDETTAFRTSSSPQSTPTRMVR